MKTVCHLILTYRTWESGRNKMNTEKNKQKQLDLNSGDLGLTCDSAMHINLRLDTLPL